MPLTRAERSRRWRLDNPERQKAHARRHHLKRKFGITVEQYIAMLAMQGGSCAICGTRDTHPWEYFVVDHDHSTGAVRGLLCHACNTCIGQAQDDPQILRAAIDYLEAHETNA